MLGGLGYIRKPSRSRTNFTECQFIGEGQEDIRNIIRRQTLKYLNEQAGYRKYALHEELSKKELRSEYWKPIK